MRRVSPYLTWVTVRYTPLGADAVTAGAILCGLVGAGLIVLQSAAAFVLAALLLQTSYLMDTFDGEVARVRGTASPRGTYLDLIGHVLQNRALFAASGAVLAQAAGYRWWALAIALLGCGLAAPFGHQSRAAVGARLATAHSEGTEVVHGGRPVAQWPTGRSVLSKLWWLYRRLTFLWAYPASMNLYCIALLVDTARFLSGQERAVALPAFAAVFLATLALKQTAHALSLLRRELWPAQG